MTIIALPPGDALVAVAVGSVVGTCTFEAHRPTWRSRLPGSGITLLAAAAGVASLHVANLDRSTTFGQSSPVLAGAETSLILLGAAGAWLAFGVGLWLLESTRDALEANSPWWPAALSSWGLRLASHVGHGGIAAILILLALVVPWFWVALPCALLVAWLAYRYVGMLVAARRSWEQIATIHDVLPDRDLGAVLHTAAHGALRIFAATVIEVELHTVTEGPRLVRIDERTVFDGSPEDAGAVPVKPAKVVSLERPGLRVGVRLFRYKNRQHLTRQEARMVNAFTASLLTAVENALAFERVEYRAYHDSLTALPNRWKFIEHVQEALRENSAGTAIAILDVDNFRLINNALGRAAADEVLRKIGDRLRPQGDERHLAARIGGDSFAVAVSSLPADDALAHLERLLIRLRRTISIASRDITVRASAGLTYCTRDDTAADSLQRADRALSRAKSQPFQPLSYYVDGEPQNGDERACALLNDLPTALQAAQIRTVYTPVVDLMTGYPVAIEAEPEWVHPRYGRIPEWEWSDLARRSGLTAGLTGVVLRQALVATETWRVLGFDIPVAVRISGEELSLDHRLPGRVFGHLLATGVPADRLILEVTEADPLSDGFIFDELEAAGVLIALKEFGTGSCSLVTLSKIPFHGLMIDRRFTSELATRAAAVVVKAAVVLGGDLGINVAAAGLESHEQRVLLASMGIKFGQGRLVGESVPLTDLLKALNEARASAEGKLLASLPSHDLVIPIHGRRSA
ncbi:EAL domain-containing protein [Micromonospora haikouensis]|uniref:EAL domain-containing protein n=1 Tax=Micromonospora haikouensis TaxID=686309 RepID=UPI0036A3DA25